MYRYIVHVWEPRQDKGRSKGPEGGRDNGWKKEGQMEVTWLLTNRKHGGKTKSVSVLKAALKRTKGMGKNRKTTVNDRERGRGRRISEIKRK